MKTVSMNLAIHSAQKSFKDLLGNLGKVTLQSSDSWLARIILWPVDLLFLPKLKRNSTLIAETCKNFKLYVLDVRQNLKQELIDPEFQLHKDIENLKSILCWNIEAMNKAFPTIERCGILTEKTSQTIKVLIDLSKELYEEADLLQQSVSEHDANYSAKKQETTLLLKKVNVDRMTHALAEDTIVMPKGLTREEMRNFIISHASHVAK